MQKMMTTKEAAVYLHVNEKMVYSLIADKGLPATKVTGKWLFPRQLVEQWVESNTTNVPDVAPDFYRKIEIKFFVRHIQR